MSQPEIFIIESLRFEDERAERFEGRIISQILALSGKRQSVRAARHLICGDLSPLKRSPDGGRRGSHDQGLNFRFGLA